MSEFDDSCPICYEAFNERDVATTKCGHKFHTTCLLENAKHASFNCPCCREQLVEHGLTPPRPQRMNMSTSTNLRSILDRFILNIDERLLRDGVISPDVKCLVRKYSVSYLRNKLGPVKWLGIVNLLQSDETLYPEFRQYFLEN